MISVVGYLPSEIALYFQNCCILSKERKFGHNWDKSLLRLFKDNVFMLSVVGYLPSEIA
jgi:hypothetical protein